VEAILIPIIIFINKLSFIVFLIFSFI